MLSKSVRAVTAEVLLLLSLGSGGESAKSAERPESSRQPTTTSDGLANTEFHPPPTAADFAGLTPPPKFTVPADRANHGYLPFMRRRPAEPPHHPPASTVPRQPRNSESPVQPSPRAPDPSDSQSKIPTLRYGGPKAETPTQRDLPVPVRPAPYKTNVGDDDPTNDNRKPIQPIPDFNRRDTDRRGPLPVAVNPNELHLPDSSLKDIRPVRR